MTLEVFMSAMKNKDMRVTILNAKKEEIIRFYSEGFNGVENDILAMTVDTFEINTNNTMTIVLSDKEEEPAETETP